MKKKNTKNILKKVLGEKKFSKKEKIGPFTIVTIIFVTGILFLRPSITRIIRISKELKQKNIQLEKLIAKKRVLESYTRQDTELLLDQQLRMISKYLPSSKPSLQTLLSLVSLARGDKLQFSGLKLNPGKVKSFSQEDKEIQRAIAGDEDSTKEIDTNSLQNFEITFSIIGKKENLESFVAKLKEVSPMMRIEQFTTSFLSDDLNLVQGQNLLLSANLKLKIYYQKLPEKLPAYDEPLDTLSSEENKLLETMKDYIYNKTNIPTVETVGQGGVVGNSNPFAVGPTN
jgi:hypothetical protein